MNHILSIVSLPIKDLILAASLVLSLCFLLHWAIGNKSKESIPVLDFDTSGRIDIKFTEGDIIFLVSSLATVINLISRL